MLSLANGLGRRGCEETNCLSIATTPFLLVILSVAKDQVGRPESSKVKMLAPRGTLVL
jgi:hypothetical protein